VKFGKSVLCRFDFDRFRPTEIGAFLEEIGHPEKILMPTASRSFHASLRIADDR